MIVHADVFGLFSLILSLACLGTWPALLRLGSLEELRPSGTHELLPNLQPSIGCCRSFYYGEQLRNMCHVYLDYSTAYFAVSSVPLLLTLSLSGESTLPKMSPILIFAAMLGGGLLSIGNLSMQWATAVYGAPLTTVLAIQASLTVLLGTSLNYMLEPYKTSRPGLLLAGVLVFLVAISLATQAQWVYAKQKEEARARQKPSDELQTPYSVASVLSSLSTPHNNSTVAAVLSSLSSKSFEKARQQLMSSLSWTSEPDELEQARQQHLDDSSPYARHTTSQEGSSDDDNILDSSKTTVPDNRIPYAIIASKALFGIIVAVLGGLCYGFFSPLFNIAVNDPFQWASSSSSSSFTFYFGNNAKDYYPHDADAPIPRGAGDALTDQLLVARTNLWFSFAFWITSCVGNTILLKRQAPLSSWTDLWKTYLTQDSMWDRQLAFTAGMICAVGNVLQFQGGQLVGYAAADLVQAYPIVSTVWDVFLFREFRQVRVRSYLFCELLGMYAAYLTGIGLLAGSSMLQ